MTPVEGIHIYEVSECEWWAGRTAEEAVEYFIDCFAYQGDEAKDVREWVRELSDSEADGLILSMELVDGPGWEKETFRAALKGMIRRGESFPCHFASTEY